MDSANLTTIRVSLLVAVATAIISSIINWVIWSFQFSRKEKSASHKLYLEKRLEIYTQLHEMLLGGALLEALCLINAGDTSEKNSVLLSTRYAEIIKYVSEKQIFISNDCKRILQERLTPCYQKISDKVRDKESDPEDIAEFWKIAHQIGNQISKELGLDVLDRDFIKELLRLAKRMKSKTRSLFFNLKDIDTLCILFSLSIIIFTVFRLNKLNFNPKFYYEITFLIGSLTCALWHKFRYSYKQTLFEKEMKDITEENVTRSEKLIEKALDTQFKIEFVKESSKILPKIFPEGIRDKIDYSELGHKLKDAMQLCFINEDERKDFEKSQRQIPKIISDTKFKTLLERVAKTDAGDLVRSIIKDTCINNGRESEMAYKRIFDTPLNEKYANLKYYLDKSSYHLRFYFIVIAIFMMSEIHYG